MGDREEKVLLNTFPPQEVGGGGGAERVFTQKLFLQKQYKIKGLYLLAMGEKGVWGRENLNIWSGVGYM